MSDLDFSAKIDADIAYLHRQQRGGTQAECVEDAIKAYVAAAPREELGEALMRVRLAITALALITDGFSDDHDEPTRILAALCAYLIEHGAIDPMEAS